jgi:prepilin-type N-terminal cleavage/methylation domain-containing protein
MKTTSINQSGMSLMEVMVALGIMGVISVGVMKMNEETFKTQKTSETSITTSQILLNAQGILSSEENCNLNFKDFIVTRDESAFNTSGGNASLNSLFNPPTLNTVPENSLWRKSPPNNPVKFLTVGEVSSDGTIKVTGLSTKRAGNDAFNLLIKFERLKNVYGSTIFTKTLKFSATFADTPATPADLDDDTITSCYVDDSAIIESAVAKSCTGSGAIYDPILNECNHPSIEESSCYGGRYVRSIIYDYSTSSFRPVCGFPLPARSCPPGQVFVKSHQNGGFSCKNVISIINDSGLLNTLVDPTPVTGVGTTSCNAIGLVVNANKIKLVCNPPVPPPACNACGTPYYDYIPYTSLPTPLTQHGPGGLNSYTHNCSYKVLCDPANFLPTGCQGAPPPVPDHILTTNTYIPNFDISALSTINEKCSDLTPL